MRAVFIVLLVELGGCTCVGLVGSTAGTPTTDAGTPEQDAGPAQRDAGTRQARCPQPVLHNEPFDGGVHLQRFGFSQATDDDLQGPLGASVDSNPIGPLAVTQLPDGALVVLAGHLDVGLYFLYVCGAQVERIAGSGMPGFRDGPAEQAMFGMHLQWHYNTQFGLFSDNDGTVYFTDFENGRVRTLSRDSANHWLMKTVIGGGSRELAIGESAPATEVKINTYQSPFLAMASEDLFWVIAAYELYRFTPSTGRLTRMPFANIDGVLYAAAGDLEGHGFFVSESSNACSYFRIDPDGSVVKIAGKAVREGSVYAGAPDETFFWTVPGLAAPAGRYLYANGGDSPVPRRISKDGTEDVAALLKSNTWGPLVDSVDGQPTFTLTLSADRMGGVLTIGYGRMEY